MTNSTRRGPRALPFALAMLLAGACGSSSAPPSNADATARDSAPTAADDATAGDASAAGADATAAGSDAAIADATPDATPADAPATPDAATDAATPDAAAPDAAPLPPDAAPDVVAMCGKILCDCTFRGKQLFGGMNYVTNPPYDFKVEVVTNNLPDLYVEEVTGAGLATHCGVWKTDSFVPTFKVLKVTAPAIPDFTIQYDDLLPGIPGHRP
jgi:hypothetical protein